LTWAENNNFNQAHAKVKKDLDLVMYPYTSFHRP